jgi:hypothetical protein
MSELGLDPEKQPIRMVIVNGLSKRMSQLKKGEHFSVVPATPDDVECPSGEYEAKGDGFVKDGQGGVMVDL